jgi:Na+-driven multidrug efflux pump
MQWLVFLPLAWLVGPFLGWGLFAVWAANVVYRLIQSGIFAALWRGERWTEVKV